MNRKRPFLMAVVTLSLMCGTSATMAAEQPKADAGERPADPKPILLWPGAAPGDPADIGGAERDSTKDDEKTPPNKRGVIRLAHVSKPTLTVFKPAADKDTGTAVVVCPGGGYSILAYNMEGTEICQWLNSVGVTGVLLKYRVPVRPGTERYAPPLQDVQRAIGLVRQHATEWKIDAKKVGVMGFSAGGHLSAVVSNQNAERTYPAVDDADKQPCRPDFAMLIYPAYLVGKTETTKLAPELPVTKNTPPTFIAMTQDDPVKVEGAYAYALALKAVKVPAELHIYATGGHGYGMRPGDHPVSTEWPKRAAEWMKSMGWLKKA